jgi:signal transduction histidine kinase
LRRVTRTIHGRLEERVRERERIARELHDTLLQGMYGLVLRFQAVADQLDHAHPVRRSIDDALERADRAMAEGRDRVEGLRACDDGETDLATALRDAAADASAGHDGALRVVVTRQPRTIQAVVRDEVFWVGREAIANARHAGHATGIDVMLTLTED